MPPRRAKENAGAAGAPPPPLTLEVIAGPCRGAVFSERLERVRIGRVKTHNNVHVKDPSVSQKHAEVAWSGSAWEVTDLGSSNGTWVNEVEVAREGAPVALADGDELALGEATIFKVSLAPAADAAGPTVEEFLRAQCDAICARLQAEAEAEVKLLREESKLALAELRALA